MWRRLAWMHLQVVLMTADSFLLLRLQSHSNIFFNFIYLFFCGTLSKRAALFCWARSIKSTVCFQSRAWHACNLNCCNAYGLPFDLFFGHLHYDQKYPPPHFTYLYRFCREVVTKGSTKCGRIHYNNWSCCGLHIPDFHVFLSEI